MKEMKQLRLRFIPINILRLNLIRKQFTNLFNLNYLPRCSFSNKRSN